MKAAILGTGTIAQKMAGTMGRLADVECCAVASRDIGRAKDFADRFGCKKAYGRYEDMLDAGGIDLVYIALPHPLHHEWTIKALRAGKNVLCEKPMAVNQRQAREMFALAEERNLLLAEAMWPRYMPSAKTIKEIADSGEIGEVTNVYSNVGDRNDAVDRVVNPALGGGCLLDLTVYSLSFSSMILGTDIKKITANMIPTGTGVDGQNMVMIEYTDGKMAGMFATIYSMTDRSGLISGRDGFIEVPNIINPDRIVIHKAGHSTYGESREIVFPAQITGYEYEVLACKRAIEAGLTECEEMPRSETLAILGQADEIRKQFGIVYPFEDAPMVAREVF